MANYGFSYVSEQGYVSFANALETTEWKSISLAGFESAANQGLPSALLQATRPVYWKLRLQRALATLSDTLQKISGQSPSAVDPKWDAAQLQLRSLIVAATEDEDPQIQEAGQRLFRALLLGDSGLGQNRLPYQQEADHGAMQVELASKAPLLADVQLVGVEKCMARVARVTKELNSALGREPGQTSQLASNRTELLQQALNIANEAFNSVLSDIDWHLQNLENDAKEQLSQLRAPIQALLDRYPAPRAAKAEAKPA